MQVNIRPEDVEAWESFDKDVRDEIVGNIGICQDMSDMNEREHPKHGQYVRAHALVLRILES